MALVTHKWSNWDAETRNYIISLCQQYLDCIIRGGRSVDSNIWEVYAHLAPEVGKEYALAMAIYSTIELYSLVDMIGLQQLVCKHKYKDKTIVVEDVISRSRPRPDRPHPTMIVFRGRIPSYTYDNPVAIKWYRGKQHDITHEMRLYDALEREESGVTIWHTSNYILWKDPVLILLEGAHLSGSEDEREVGIAILRKLRVIHRVCLHCDIKPDNIVKSSGGTGTTSYYLIDFGHSTPIDMKTETHHVRRVYTRSYCRKNWKNRTSIRTDLLELLYTLKRIQLDRLEQDGDCRRGFKGALGRYYAIIETMPEYPHGEDVYDQLIHALE